MKKQRFLEEDCSCKTLPPLFSNLVFVLFIKRFLFISFPFSTTSSCMPFLLVDSFSSTSYRKNVYKMHFRNTKCNSNLNQTCLKGNWSRALMKRKSKEVLKNGIKSVSVQYFYFVLILVMWYTIDTLIGKYSQCIASSWNTLWYCWKISASTIDRFTSPSFDTRTKLACVFRCKLRAKETKTISCW